MIECWMAYKNWQFQRLGCLAKSWIQSHNGFERAMATHQILLIATSSRLSQLFYSSRPTRLQHWVTYLWVFSIWQADIWEAEQEHGSKPLSLLSWRWRSDWVYFACRHFAFSQLCRPCHGEILTQHLANTISHIISSLTIKTKPCNRCKL